ncbi:glutamate receptor ionotropic, kainate glr-3-like [Schistocerca serialis cubense]|uniref:glutamate receptor ionotropic, kainate glr-3-like n=1 Tax=Schistocerca serialis cubense TaxID=2023355 RepID=UPI00214EDD51|nr:glutamate receptor ionotropic, kainate glr-3-like [Schistocerca serialis cubense]
MEKYIQVVSVSGIDSEITVVERTDESKFQFSEVYNIIRGKMQTILLGNWTNQKTAMDLLPKHYKFSTNRRGNLYLNPLRIVLARMTNNFNPKNFSIKTGYQPFDLNIEIFLLFQEMFNFSLDIIDSNAVTGDAAVLKTITNGDADIAPIIMGVIRERAEFIHFIHPIGGLRLSMLFVRPTKASLQNVFFLPFSVDVWLSVFTVTILTFLTLTFAVMSVNKKENCSDYSWNVSEILLLTIGLACQQSSTRLPNSTAANMIINWFSFVAILLFSAYSGQIISFLSVHESPIQSVSDLSAFHYKLGVDMFPYISHLFKISKNKDIQDLGVGHELIPSQSALLFVSKGRRCYCTSDFNMHKILNRLSGKEYCKYEVIRLADGTVLLAMSVAHNSPYREMMNYGTLKIRERGVLSRYKGWHSTDTDICFRDVEPVEIVDLLPVFILLSSGILLSLSFLFIEILYHKIGL